MSCWSIITGSGSIPTSASSVSNKQTTLDIRDYQEVQLFILIRAAKNTRFGERYNFTDLQRYEDFRETVPISFYEDINSRIEDLKSGAENLFWPGTINKFAVSAGTSGEGKHLPLSEKRLKSDKRFMNQVASSYLRQRPNILNLWGKHISLPGTLEQKGDIYLGEISGFTARQIPWWLSLFQLIPAEELVNLPFQKKINKVIEKGIKKDVRVISSAPSWLLTMFQRILEQTGAQSIAEIWPNLKLLVCGGVKLANYRDHLQNLIQNPAVDFIETYGASEGYFSYTDDLREDDMKLVIDNRIFYEFVPHPLPDQDSLAIQQTVPLWEVEPDTPYAMIVSTDAGLWRYPMNDIIRFTQTDPPRIKVMGRVSEMLDDYGEALYAYEANQALVEAASALEISICDFAIGATIENQQSAPKHFWFVQIPDPVHRDTLNRLAERIDSILIDKNRHYAIRRESGALGKPEVNSISQQQINNWLEENEKQKAQGKLPSILTGKEDIRFFKSR